MRSRQENFCDYTDFITACHRRRYQFVRMSFDSLDVVSAPDTSSSLDESREGATSSQLLLEPGILDREITKEVFDILNNTFTEVCDVIGTFRESVYPWLPIICITEFKEQVASLQQDPVAEIATLLLATYLVNQISTPRQFWSRNVEGCTVLNMLLSTCRRFFTILQLDRKERLETIQSGILLSVLELYSGFFDEASLTITTCARVGIKIGLQHIYAMETQPYSELEMTKRNMWCSMFMLDR
jgi:hypothetical protein